MTEKKKNRTATQNAAEELYTALFDQIVSGKQPAQNHLKEEALAEQFGVSRTPVREALRLLAQDGLVELLSRQGARVIPFTADDIEDLYDMRMALELLALDIAGQSLRLQYLKEIREDILARPIRKERHTHTNIDARLHRYLIESTGRRYLSMMYNRIERLMQHFRLLGFKNPEVAKRANEEHIALIDAILVRDIEKAKTILREHIKNSKICVLSILRTAPQSSPSK